MNATLLMQSAILGRSIRQLTTPAQRYSAALSLPLFSSASKTKASPALCSTRNYLAASSIRHNGEDSHSDFEPKRKTPAEDEQIQNMIKGHVEENMVMLYMKGSPNAPQCGFSAKTVRYKYLTL